MIKKIFLILTIFVAGKNTVWSQDYPALLEKVKPSVVLISSYNQENELVGLGSGFFVGSNYIMTNRHVLAVAYRANVKLSNGERHPIVGIILDEPSQDLVVVQVGISADQLRPVTIEEKLPSQGEKIIVVSNPLGLEQTVSDGIVSAVRDIGKFGNVIQMTAPISSGSSGSPVVNIKGNVIGINTFQQDSGQNLNFAIPISRLYTLKIKKLTSLSEWTQNSASEDDNWTKNKDQRGEIYFMLRDYKSAKAYYEQKLKVKPNQSDSLVKLGDCNLELAQGDKNLLNQAIESYKKALEIRPNYPEANEKLAKAYASDKQWQSAIQKCNRSIQLDSDRGSGYSTLGSVYFQKGEYKKAIECCRKSLQFEQNTPDSYRILTESYQKVENWKDSIESSLEWIEKFPLDASAHYKIGLGYVKVGQPSDAFETYQRLIRLDKKLSGKLLNQIYP